MERRGATLWARSARIKRSCFRWLAAAPLAVALLAVGGLVTSTSSSAATTNSSGEVVSNTVSPSGTLFYDPSTHLALMIDFPVQDWCNPDYTGAGAVPLDLMTVTSSTGIFIRQTAHATGVSAYLYKTSSPIPNSGDDTVVCGAITTPPIGTGTVSLQVAFWAAPGTSGNSGTWEQMATGSYVDAATGKTCHVTASGSGPWSSVPFYAGDTASINTHGC